MGVCNFLSEQDLVNLESLINEEILSFINSGYSIDNEYIIDLRNLLKKFDLKELYSFDYISKANDIIFLKINIKTG